MVTPLFSKVEWSLVYERSNIIYRSKRKDLSFLLNFTIMSHNDLTLKVRNDYPKIYRKPQLEYRPSKNVLQSLLILDCVSRLSVVLFWLLVFVLISGRIVEIFLLYDNVYS